MLSPEKQAALVSDPSSNDEDYFRREAMGAFAHEIRTPLTSIRMVVELARRQAGGGETLTFEPDLAGMLQAAITDLQQLADDLQEQSRLERGRITLSEGPCELGAAIDAARKVLRPGIVLASPAGLEPLEGPWDPPRLTSALAAFADAANRMGDGSGVIHLEVGIAPDAVTLRFESGQPGGAIRPIDADAGFGFFRARQFVLAAGGTVAGDRRDRYISIAITLPRRAAPVAGTAG